MAVTDACASRLPALNREGRGVPVRGGGFLLPPPLRGGGGGGGGDATNAAAGAPLPRPLAARGGEFEHLCEPPAEDWHPTISCINIRRVPQVLGRRRPICYPASTSFDRHI